MVLEILCDISIFHFHVHTSPTSFQRFVPQKNCSHQVVKHLLCHQLLLWVSWRVLCPHPGDYIFINGPFFRWAGWWVGWIHYKKEDRSWFWFCSLSVIWGKVPEFRLAHRKFSEFWCFGNLEIWCFATCNCFSPSGPSQIISKKRVDQNDRPQDEGIEHGDSRILWIIITLPLAFNGSSSSFVDFRGVESDMWMYPRGKVASEKNQSGSEDW